MVKVLDKEFDLYMSRSEIQAIVDRLASEITRDYKDKNPLICPVLTGSYLFAADLTRAIGFDHEVSFVRYSSYSGMSSTGCVKESLPFPKSCTGRHVIIVEDVVDTGVSMECMLHRLKALNPASVAICSFLFKPGCFHKDFKIDYVGKSIPDDFVVGYGLDYNEMGRTLSEVYSLHQ